MRKITVFFIAMVLISTISVNNINAAQQTELKPIVVEDNYFLSDSYRIVQGKNTYEKISIHGKEHYKQAVQSTKEVLRLPIILDIGEMEDEFLMPSDIAGIVPDIPYNYYSSIDSSSRYFYTLLQNGWEIEYYNASSLCIQVGLVNNQGIACRLLIFEDFLKVYCRLM